METRGSTAAGTVENHMSGGKYQPCRWTGSAWVPVAATRKPAARISGVCPRCHTYCYGDCRS